MEPTFSLPNCRVSPVDKIIIIAIFIVVVVVTDFSDSEPRLRRLVYRRSGGYGDWYRQRPDFEFRNRRGGGGGGGGCFFFFFALFSVRGEDADSGKTFCRNVEILI